MGLLLAVPFILLAMPSTFFDHTGVELCLSKLLFNRTCYACGMTRAIMHLIHFDFQTAMSYNKMALLVLPFLMYLWYGELKRTMESLEIKIAWFGKTNKPMI